MKLYYLPFSPYSHKVQLALLEKGIDVETEVVMPLDPEQRAVYRELFPLGKLPMLHDGEQMIHESSFIIEHIDYLSGEPRLLPENTEDFRAVRYKDRLADNYLTEPAIPLFFQSLVPEEKQDETRIAQSRHRIACSYRMIEKILKENNGEFFHGNSITLADLSLLPALRVSSGHIPFDDYGNICEYYEKQSQSNYFKGVDKEANIAMDALNASLRS